MQFESIRGNMQRFLDLMHAHGGPEGMIQNGIPWEQVVWGSTYDEHTEYIYFEIEQQKDEKGELHFFTTSSEGYRKEWTKRDLAYVCDLYDKDGKLLNIMFLGF